jgi:hypothetical protein
MLVFHTFHVAWRDEFFAGEPGEPDSLKKAGLLMICDLNSMNAWKLARD